MKLEKKRNLGFQNMIENITDKKIAISMMVVLIISLVPIVVLGFYNYPFADDFSASDTAHWAWQETGSLVAVLKAALENVWYNYQSWSGVYASVFWTSLQPGLFGEKFYGMTTLISVVLLVAAGGSLTCVIIKKNPQGNPYSWISLCALYLFTTMQCMPDGNEGLYWHPGTANYTWGFAFLLFLVACVLSIHGEERKGKIVAKLIVSCILAVLAGGGNYITALQGCLWLGLIDVIIIGKQLYQKNAGVKICIKKNLTVLFPTLVLMIAFLASVLAPGNQVRMGMSSSMNPVAAVIESFKYTLTVPVKEWFGWQTYLLLLLAVPFMWNLVKESECKFNYPGIVAVLGFCFTAAGFTPSLYAQGRMEAGRLHDTVYFILIFIIYIVLFYCLGWLYHKKYTKDSHKGQKNSLDNKTKKCLLVLIALWIAGSVLYMGINIRIYIGTDALYAIVSGQAKAYQEINEQRLELLNSEEEQLVLPKITEAPLLLMFEDISTNPEEWVNTAMATYYKKESVQREE